ncbi:MAG: RNA polymerase sigma-70 factor [Bacteroidales bacterium]|nr:RNA polymerase sigma-70 factor [Bacteroidales bacterium]
MTTNEEYILLRALGNSDRKAFAVLYNLYAGKCLAFLESLLKDHEQAKDVTHDIFIKVWQKREIISKVDSFSSYLFKMARNAVMDKFESETIRRRYVARQMLCQEDFRSYVDEVVSVDELQMMIFKAVSRMPEQRRRIFTLSRYKGMSNAEIARLCGLNVRTVENHITNALADIRMLLAESSA